MASGTKRRETSNSSNTSKASSPTTVFSRSATGLVRDISPHQAFIYNFMAIGLCTFTWVTLFSIAYSQNFLGSSVGLAIVLMALAAIPFYLCTAMLSSAMPRSGGDYVWQSRVLHPAIAFAATLSAWTVWQWYFAGFLGSNIVTLGLEPYFALLGTSGNAYYQGLASTLGSQSALFGLTTLVIVLGFVIAALGMKFYVRLQYLLFAGSLASALTLLGVLATTTSAGFASSFNSFAAPLVQSSGNQTLINAVNSDHGFYNYVIATANLGAPSATVSLWPTLLLFGVIWISFGYAFWSIYNLSEIKRAGSLKTQTWIQVGSSLAFSVFLIALWYLLENVVGLRFLESFYTLFYNGSGAIASVNTLFANSTYYPALIASISSSPIVWTLILVGLSFGIFQVILIVYFASTRILLAASMDRVLPSQISYVNSRTHSPLVALVISAVGCEAFLWLIVYDSNFLSYFSTAGLATQVAYILISLTAILFPLRKKEIFEASPVGKYKAAGVPLISILGAVALVVNLFIAWIYVAGPPLGILSTPYTSSIEFVVGIFAVCLVIYLISWGLRRGQKIDISLSFKEIPPE